MATFSAQLSMPGLSYSKTAELPDEAAALVVASMKHRLSPGFSGKVQDRNEDGSLKVDEAGAPLLRDMTIQEAVDASLNAYVNGWLQNVREDARERAEAAARASVPVIPDYTVVS